MWNYPTIWRKMVHSSRLTSGSFLPLQWIHRSRLHAATSRIKVKLSVCQHFNKNPLTPQTVSFHGRASPGQEPTGCYCVSESQVQWCLSVCDERTNIMSSTVTWRHWKSSGGNQEPQGHPGGSWNPLGDSDLGNCLFPVMPLDVTQPNTSWSWLSLQAVCLHLLYFTPTFIGARRSWILVAHSDPLVLCLIPRCFKEKYNVLRSVRHRDPGSGGRGAYCFAGTRWSVKAHRSALSLNTPTNQPIGRDRCASTRMTSLVTRLFSESAEGAAPEEMRISAGSLL